MSRRSSRAIEEELGQDLWGLISSQPSLLVEATSVGSLPSPLLQRAAFQLRFADGRVLKGRRFDSAHDAERIERLSGWLDPRHFPRLLARRGCAVLTEWIDGEAPTPTACGPDLLREAGALQGALHRTPVPEDLLRDARARLGRWRSRLEGDLAELVERGGLDGGEAARVLDLAVSRAPEDSDVGLGHGDLCPGNLVVRGGVLQVVDNESLLVHACDYHLACTWYRWPMTRAQWAAFEEGYRQHRDPGGFVARLPYWAVLVLVDSALFRLRGGIAAAGRPLDRLRAVVRAEDRRGARGPLRGPSG